MQQSATLSTDDSSLPRSVDQTLPAALSGIRVLELPGPAGQYCGKMFADLGADVILIEPPCGADTRREGPFLRDQIDRECSLPFTYFNTGKRSVVLNLGAPEGRMVFRKLAERASLIIDTEKPGMMASLGLGFDSLSAASPGIIMTSITPFGQTGPYAQWECDDIVALALGGLLSLGGYPESEPMAPYGNQAYLAAGQFAAVASLMALLANEQSGGDPCPRHIDVSIQECVALGLENAVQFYDLENTIRKREAGRQKLAGMGIFPCADGHVYLMAGGIASSNFWANTVQWLEDERVAGADQLKGACWHDQDFLATEEAKGQFHKLFGPFALSRTKSYLYDEGQSRRVPICPVNSPEDLVHNRQLQHRNYFTAIAHSSGESLKGPGAPYRLTATPWRLAGPCPTVGQHTAEILDELGFDRESQAAFFACGAAG
jgi:benzylsuccinate CoA-transferase BbsE subunit